MDQTAENTTSNLIKDVAAESAKALIVSLAATVGTVGGLVVVGAAITKLQERKARKTQQTPEN